ncbi:uncharacterized protein LOC123643331 [Lemur catta]|uniref:uncharacterized protein LOC123643331 n=1 Tax=Lemur catta TaxID=9447 RepID=UPI001E26DD75|nr:uncharacterized protein LOC123643331 [Lemur catta]
MMSLGLWEHPGVPGCRVWLLTGRGPERVECSWKTTPGHHLPPRQVSLPSPLSRSPRCGPKTLSSLWAAPQDPQALCSSWGPWSPSGCPEGWEEPAAWDGPVAPTSLHGEAQGQVSLTLPSSCSAPSAHLTEAGLRPPIGTTLRAVCGISHPVDSGPWSPPFALSPRENVPLCHRLLSPSPCSLHRVVLHEQVVALCWKQRGHDRKSVSLPRSRRAASRQRPLSTPFPAAAHPHIRTRFVLQPLKTKRPNDDSLWDFL